MTLALFQAATPIPSVVGTQEGGGFDWSVMLAGASVLVTILIWASTEYRMSRWRKEDRAKREEDEKPKLKVSVYPGYFIRNHPTRPGRKLAWNTINIEVQNVGKVEVTINPPFIRALENQDSWRFFDPAPLPNVSFSDTEFPRTLQPGTAVTASIRATSLSSAMKESEYSGTVRIIGMYESQIGGKFPSHPYDFDVDRDWWSEDQPKA